MVIISDEIISGFIGEAISRCVDFSWTKIKEAVKNRKNKHQNIESQIYNVIVNVLNQITYNKFENEQDKIYQAAEKLLIGYKDSKCDSIEVVKSGLQILGENFNSDKYIEFENLLYQELGKDDYEELYRQIRLLQQDEESDKTSRIEKKVDKLQRSANETIWRLDAFQENNRRKRNIQNKEPVKSRTQEYADKWEANMFLNDFDKRDENAGVNIKLREVYLEEHLPHYIWGNNTTTRNDLKELLKEYVCKHDDNKMLLVLGQPGIGKSTLITWITANFIDSKDSILIYKFASDLKNVDWINTNFEFSIADQILNELYLSYENLTGKTLIIDGFDEISVGDNREKVLNRIYWQLVKGGVDGLSLIITCRENYIRDLNKLECTYITLRAWNETQISNFCKVFQEESKNSISEWTIKRAIDNKDVFGIPLILYMVVALNISIEEEGSIIDVYDKIFSLEGGIYDRCIGNKSFADEHRIAKIKKQIHQISREIALWMFENNSNEASIPQEKYQLICGKIMQEQKNIKEIKQDFLIGNFFKLVKHCEGIDTEKLYFVHRTIYEYFVVETIYSSIECFMIELSEKSQEEFVGNIAFYLKKGNITYMIGKYLHTKMLRLYNGMDHEKKKRFLLWWEMSVGIMMDTGMFYYTKRNIQDYRNIINREINCFMNLIDLLRLISHICKEKYIMERINKVQLQRYIKYLSIEYEISKYDQFFHKNIMILKLDLMNMNLSELNLCGLNFSSANLMDTNLRKANLRRVDFKKANLRGADLEGADLRGANLEEAVGLKDANIKGAIFDERQVKYLQGICSLLGTKVFDNEIGSVIRYEQYCKRINEYYEW